MLWKANICILSDIDDVKCDSYGYSGLRSQYFFADHQNEGSIVINKRNPECTGENYIYCVAFIMHIHLLTTLEEQLQHFQVLHMYNDVCIVYDVCTYVCMYQYNVVTGCYVVVVWILNNFIGFQKNALKMYKTIMHLNFYYLS